MPLPREPDTESSRARWRGLDMHRRKGDCSTPDGLHPQVPARCLFFFQAEDGIRDVAVTGVQTCALPISCNGQAHTRTAHEVSLIFSPIEFVKDHGLLKIVDPGTVVGNAGRHRVSGKLGGNGNWLLFW